MKSLISLAIRILLAGLFFYAGAVKASASQEFAIALLPFTFVPPEWTIPLALSLAWSEIIASLMLLLPRVHRIGAFLVAAMCLLYVSVLGWALCNGIIVSCNCFGGDEPPSAWKMQLAIGRDILIFLGAVWLILPARMEKNT